MGPTSRQGAPGGRIAGFRGWIKKNYKNSGYRPFNSLEPTSRCSYAERTNKDVAALTLLNTIEGARECIFKVAQSIPGIISHRH